MAVALAGRPGLLIADEPTTALDVTVQAQVVSLFRKFIKESDMAALFVSHDLALVAGIADRIAVMYSGAVVEEGPVGDIFNKPLHPYTRGLLNVADQSSGTFATMGGEIPDPLNLPPGCRFAPRCPLAVDRCASGLPDLIAFGPGRRARCIRAGEAG